MFLEEAGAQFLFMLIFVAVVYFFIQRSSAGTHVPEIRKVAGLEYIDTAIGRATEMGRPVHFTPGLFGVDAPETLASFAILGHVARESARYDARLIVSNFELPVLGINQEIVRQAYLEAGRPERFNPLDVRYMSSDQFGYAAGVAGLLHRENVGANIMVGAFAAEAMVLAESGYQAGALQVGGTTFIQSLPWFIVAADHTLIGEEIYAAGAYLSRDPVLTGTIAAQDLAKIGIIGLVILGTFLNTLGLTWLETVLSW
ncbi:MAG: hypothetical protein HYY09_05675 [Firmicutes bacterium]|nr:hypothetical protein [Bacillota bacterium]